MATTYGSGIVNLSNPTKKKTKSLSKYANKASKNLSDYTKRASAYSTSRSSRPSTGTGSGSAAPATSSARKPSTSKTSNSWQRDIGSGPDIYSSIMGQLAGLTEQYAALKNQYSYTPQDFVGGVAPTADQFAEDARKRAASEVAAKVAAYGGREASAMSAYEQARAAAYAENARNIAALESGQSQDVGRMQAMASNMGLGAGFGNMANTYGVQGDYASRMAQANADTSLSVNNAAMQQAAERAAIAGDVASARALSEARAFELQDSAYQTALGQHNANQDRAASVWGQGEQNRQAASQAQLEAALAALSGQSANANATATLMQDWRDFSNQNAWANRNFNYNAYNDNRAYDINKSTLGLQQQNANDTNYWNRMQYGLDAAGQTSNMRQALLNLYAEYPKDSNIRNYLIQMGLIGG